MPVKLRLLFEVEFKCSLYLSGRGIGKFYADSIVEGKNSAIERIKEFYTSPEIISLHWLTAGGSKIKLEFLNNFDTFGSDYRERLLKRMAQHNITELKLKRLRNK